MTEPLGFSVRIFVPFGDPEGIRVVEKSNWTGQGIYFSRPSYTEVRSKLAEEISRSGVYILWNTYGSGETPTVYVGEGDVVKPRLDSHANNKDFWTHAVTFVSKDRNLNKAHVQYLEARLIEIAREAKRCDLDNGNSPQPPSLAWADRVDAELYLKDMLLCLPVLGVSFFEKARSPAETTRNLFLNSTTLKAQGFEDGSGFVVRRGSQASMTEAPSIHKYLTTWRNQLLNDWGILVKDGETYRFTSDYKFPSPSTASGVLLGRTSNGRTDWRDGNGKTLRELQEAVDILP